MSDLGKKFQKKLIFDQKYVWWADKPSEAVSAITREWDLIRAALRGEPIHLLDGFVIFQTWRECDQKTEYKRLFGRIASCVPVKLESIGIQDSKMYQLRGRQTPDYWELCFPYGQAIESNISDAVQICKQSVEAFRKGNALAGWALIRKAYETWPDALSISQAIVLSNGLEKAEAAYEDWFDGMRNHLKSHRQVIWQALIRVLQLALEQRQGINGKIVDQVVGCWIEQLSELDDALSTLVQKKPAKSSIVDPKTKEFVHLANEFGDSFDYQQKGKYIEDMCESTVVRDEITDLLKRLCKCDFTIDAVEEITHFFEDLKYRWFKDDSVYNCLQSAIIDFIKSKFPIQEDSSVYGQFSRYLRIYVKKSHTREGIANIYDSDKDFDQKREQIISLLEGITDKDELKAQVRQILEGKLGEENIPGKLAVTPSKNLSFGVDFQYLRPIEEVLKIGTDEKPKWFRKTGPIAADFGDDRVYCRNELLEKLRSLVIGNQFSMLEGIGATGKTVLVRQLGLELSNEKNRPIYYFDCDLNRDFDQNKLIEEINSISGVVILENIHLETNKFQSVFREVTRNLNRHILFVARPSFRESQYSRDNDLSSVHSLVLLPFDQVDEIIEHYVTRHPDLIWSEAVRQGIKENAAESFWLISYALEGFVQVCGRGDPQEWMATGVKTDLRDLEHFNPCFPEVVVALSPLYMNEVLTEESFLTKLLGFDQKVINTMVELGEVTKQQTPGGQVFYGLPHSALAETYWDHGGVYKKRRRLPEYKEFIYQYAVSDVSNGLKAVMNASEEVQKLLLARLDSEKLIVPVIEREVSADVVDDWIRDTYSGELLSDEILGILANKIQTNEDFFNTAHFIYRINDVEEDVAWELCDMLEVDLLAHTLVQPRVLAKASFLIAAILEANEEKGLRVWAQLDKKRLAQELQSMDSMVELIVAVRDFFDVNRDVGREFWLSLDIKQLADRLSHSEEILNVIYWTSWVCGANGKAGQELCNLLDIDRLTVKLKPSDISFYLMRCIAEIYMVAPAIGLKLWNAMDCKKLAPMDHDPCKVQNLCLAIDAIFAANEDMGWEFFHAIDVTELARNISCKENIEDVEEYISLISTANWEAGYKVCQLLDMHTLSKNLINHNNICEIGCLIATLNTACPQVGEKLWILLDVEKLAHWISEEEDVIHNISACIDTIYSANTEIAIAMCGSLNLKVLGERLSKTNYLLSLGEIVASLYKTDISIAREFCASLDIDKLRETISRKRNVYNSGRCIAIIGIADKDVAHGLWELLDITKLAEKLSTKESIYNVWCCIDEVYFANSEVGWKLSKMLNLEMLADRINQSHDTWFAGQCIDCIGIANKVVGQELCRLLDIENLKHKLVQSKQDHHLGLYVSAIALTSPEVGKKLLRLLNLEELGHDLSRVIEATGLCIEYIHAADKQIAQRLCERLDIRQLSNNLLRRRNQHISCSCIDSISVANEHVGHKLVKLLNGK